MIPPLGFIRISHLSVGFILGQLPKEWNFFFVKKGKGEVVVEFAVLAVWAHQRGMRPGVVCYKTELPSESGGWIPGMRMGTSSEENDLLESSF